MRITQVNSFTPVNILLECREDMRLFERMLQLALPQISKEEFDVTHFTAAIIEKLNRLNS